MAEDRLRQSWLARTAQAHARAFFFTFGALARHPLATLLTAGVIGLTLALPAALHVGLRNLDLLARGWESAAQASLFLKESVSAERGGVLARELEQRTGITGADYLSREDALEEFRRYSGFGEALDLLEGNPLPAVIAVRLSAELSAEQLRGLVDELRNLPEVDAAQLDQEWLDRLQAWLRLLRRAALLLTGLLAAAVLVIVGNTIRLDLEARREEIGVMKTIGAPDSFIRRPFLYSGLWYGLAGGMIAWVLVQTGLWLLAEPAHALSAAYGGLDFPGLRPTWALGVLAGSLVLGLAGAQLAVWRHLRGIEPR